MFNCIVCNARLSFNGWVKIGIIPVWTEHWCPCRVTVVIRPWVRRTSVVFLWCSDSLINRKVTDRRQDGWVYLRRSRSKELAIFCFFVFLFSVSSKDHPDCRKQNRTDWLIKEIGEKTAWKLLLKISYFSTPLLHFLFSVFLYFRQLFDSHVSNYRSLISPSTRFRYNRLSRLRQTEQHQTGLWSSPDIFGNVVNVLLQCRLRRRWL